MHAVQSNPKGFSRHFNFPDTSKFYGRPVFYLHSKRGAGFITDWFKELRF